MYFRILIWFDSVFDRIMRCTSSILIDCYQTWFDSFMFAYIARIICFIYIGTTRLRSSCWADLPTWDLQIWPAAVWNLSIPTMATVSGPTGVATVLLVRDICSLRSTLVATVSVLFTSVIRRCSCVGCHIFSLTYVILYHHHAVVDMLYMF